MGLFTRKPSRRDAPVYYYVQPDHSAAAAASAMPQRSSSMNSISGQAAAAALRKYQVAPQPQRGPGLAAGRSNSLSSRSFRAPPQRRANSLTAASPAYHAPNSRNTSRTNSLTSQSSRTNSITSTTTRPGPDGKTIIRTVREQSLDGRTKSITKQTIQKLGSFEIVKTTTIQSNRLPVHSAPNANEMESIVEEFDDDFYQLEEEPAHEEIPEESGVPEEDIERVGRAEAPVHQPPQHSYRNLVKPGPSPVRSILKKSSSSSPVVPQTNVLRTKSARKTRISDDDSDSGESVYSDAYDLLPNQKVTEDVGSYVSRNSVESTKKTVKISSPKHSSPKRTPAEYDEDMYERAYQIALKRVYGPEGKPTPVPTATPTVPGRTMSITSTGSQVSNHPHYQPVNHTFKTHSLRTEMPEKTKKDAKKKKSREKEMKDEVKFLKKQRESDASALLNGGQVQHTRPPSIQAAPAAAVEQPKDAEVASVVSKKKSFFSFKKNKNKKKESDRESITVAVPDHPSPAPPAQSLQTVQAQPVQPVSRVQQVPAQQLSSQQMSFQQTPVQQTPVQQTPVQQTPVEPAQQLQPVPLQEVESSPVPRRESPLDPHRESQATSTTANTSPMEEDEQQDAKPPPKKVGRKILKLFNLD